MDIHTFIDLDDIDPLYFNKAYFLGPGGEDTGKLYALLREAMGKAGKGAIVSFVMRGKEYLAAVRADGDILVLETLFFSNEVRDPHEQITDLPGRVKLSRQELSMARQLIDAMSGPWKPADYRDTYTNRVNELIEAKKNKEEFQLAQEAPAATNVVDLTEALQSSVAAARKGSGKGTRQEEAGPEENGAPSRPSRQRDQPRYVYAFSSAALDAAAGGVVDGASVVGHVQGQAGVGPPSVDQHGARAALAVIAALLRSGQAEPLAEQVEQRRRRIDGQSVQDTVDVDGDLVHLGVLVR